MTTKDGSGWLGVEAPEVPESDAEHLNEALAMALDTLAMLVHSGTMAPMFQAMTEVAIKHILEVAEPKLPTQMAQINELLSSVANWSACYKEFHTVGGRNARIAYDEAAERLALDFERLVKVTE